MSIRHTIKDKNDVGLSDDGKTIEIAFMEDYNGANYVDVPIEFIKEVLQANPLDAQVSFAEPNLIEAGWIDTKKELPNNDRFVIIYWDNGYYNEMNVASYDALDMQWYDHNRESFTDNVTHWREFPPKP